MSIETNPVPDHRQFVSRRRTEWREGRLRSVAASIGFGVLLVAADVAAGMFYSRATAMPALVDRAELTAFADSPWALDYWREFPSSSTWAYEPYVGWLREDLASDYFNVVEGSRDTWSSAQLDQDPLEIWLFGGSTMWGLGQRDDFTIPSEFAKQTDRAGLSVFVRNYGIDAHRLWQENLHLESRLLQGGRPDLVIFYDGANEPTRYASVDSRAPTHSLVEAFETQLEATDSVPRVAFDAWRDSSALLGVSRRVRRNLSSDAQAATVPSLVEPTVAVANIIGVYEEGVAIGRDIGRRHGFEVVHFWQPTLYTKAEDPAENDAWTTRGYGQRDRDWYRAVYEMARARLPRGVIDLSESLDTAPEPVFFDHTHTNELGAALVAQRIFEEVEPLLVELATRASDS